MPIHGYPGNIITANPTAPTVSAASGVWTTEQQLQAVSQGNWPGYEYPISRSLRFNSADSAYLNRTPASAGNRRTFTISYWIKRSALGSTQYLFAAGSGTTESTWFSNALDIATVQDQIGTATWTSSGGYTNAVLRDPSAWYHIVIAIDTTQATASNRSKLYINGVLQTYTGAVTISQNADLAWNNSGVVHYIGARVDSGPRMFFDGYLTEVYNIDGQALTPSSFGLNDPETGIWSPKQYTGTYGTNGFYLNFSDNSGTTSTTLGKDSSGNGNNWTPNNFSVTAGAGNDSLVDTPTSYGSDTGAGGEVRGNYCTWNPLDKGTVTVTNGNLDAVSAADVHAIRATMSLPTTGKWYWETTVSALGYLTALGIADGASSLTTGPSSAATRTYQFGSWFNSFNSGIVQYGTNQAIASGTNWTGASQPAANDVIMFAVDRDNGSMWVGRNGTWFNSSGTANPATNTDPRWTGLGSGNWFAYMAGYGASTPVTCYANFGQRPFAYTAPSGFKALCTQNLPTPTIGATSTTQANDYFNTVLYTGNGSTQSITGVGFQPDFVWIKNRGTATDHGLFDAIRGTTKRLSSNLTSAETTEVNSLTAFNSDGFSVGATQDFNQNTVGIVAWNWKANGAGSSNTDGTITSTVSANTTAGFSIATYTGNGTGGATVGHGLGVSPSWIIIKSRSNATNWMVWTDKLTTNYALEGLNTTGAEVSGGSPSKYIRAVSSTTFTIGNDASVNQSASYTYVAYCFAAVAGYSAFGSYTGNGSSDGPFVYTGFRPRWVMFKKTSDTSNWSILDTSRDDFNVSDNPLLPNTSGAESTSTSTSGAFADILSNGFKLRGNSGDINDSGATYIYAAFAESPFKYALAR